MLALAISPTPGHAANSLGGEVDPISLSRLQDGQGEEEGDEGKGEEAGEGGRQEKEKGQARNAGRREGGRRGRQAREAREEGVEERTNGGKAVVSKTSQPDTVRPLRF